MAPCDSLNPFPNTTHCAVFLDGFNRVLRTSRGETTIAAQERADRALIKTDCGYEQVAKALMQLIHHTQLAID